MSFDHGCHFLNPDRIEVVHSGSTHAQCRRAQNASARTVSAYAYSRGNVPAFISCLLHHLQQ